jgi:hypothetical protein
MLNFHRIAGVSLVASEQEAYDYWFRAVSAYLLAEQAYGLGVVFRLRYSELVDQPEASLRSLRNFLGEPFAAGCLIPSEKESTVPMYPLISSLATPTPIQQSSSVRRNFTPKSKRLRTRQRHQLPRGDKIEAAFNQRVQYVASLDSEYAKTQQEIVTLQIEREQMRQGLQGGAATS